MSCCIFYAAHGNVTLQPASILHGGLAVNIVSEFQVSQPNALSSGGGTKVVQQTQLDARDKPVNRIDLKTGSTVDDLVRSLADDRCDGAGT